jgi:hypothetical protein
MEGQEAHQASWSGQRKWNIHDLADYSYVLTPLWRWTDPLTIW